MATMRRIVAAAFLILALGLPAWGQDQQQPQPPAQQQIPPAQPAPQDATDVAPPNQQTNQPDPTARTIDQLRREIAALKEVVFAVVEQVRILIDGKFEVITTRLDAGDQATKLLQEDRDKQPARTQAAFEQLRSLVIEQLNGMQEQFKSIEKQFVERDVRTEQQAIATKTAVDAALQAAEKSVNDKNQSAAEAIAKSETNTADRINGLTTQFAAGNEATNAKIDDFRDIANAKFAEISERIQAIESNTAGQATARSNSSGDWSWMLGIGGLALAALVFIMNQNARQGSTK